MCCVIAWGGRYSYEAVRFVIHPLLYFVARAAVPGIILSPLLVRADCVAGVRALYGGGKLGMLLERAQVCVCACTTD